MKFVASLREFGRDDLSSAGGKGAYLVELVRAGLPVPDGFVITTAAYGAAVQPLDLRIAYLATRDQPTPILYGFTREEERQFWLMLKSVNRVGPKGAARAMVLPINRIAQAIPKARRTRADASSSRTTC